MKILLLLSAFLFVSCASVYSGPPPMRHLEGEKAEKEIANFTLDEHYFRQGGVYHMGPEKTPYTISSLAPLIYDIPPKAASTLETSSKWSTVSLVALGVGIGAGVVAIAAKNQQVEDRYSLISLIGSGTSILVNATIVPILHIEAAKQFNQDLRQKVTAGAQVGWRF